MSEMHCDIATKEVIRMRIMVRHDFFDKENNMCLREKGKIMEVNADRGKQLIALRLAEETKEPDKADRKTAAR